MIIDELITDRTQADLERIKTLSQKSFEQMTMAEQLEWLNGSIKTLSSADGVLRASDKAVECYNGIIKGAYNINDLNRVGTAIKYVENILHEYGYTIHTNPKTDWVKYDIPTLEQLNKLIEDVETCRAKLQLAPSVPTTPMSMEHLTIEIANNIEKILQAVYNTLMNIVESMIVYSGDIFCGEV